MRRLFALILCLLVAIPAAAADKAVVEKQFRAFLESDIWPEAKGRGVPRAVFDSALAKITLDWSLPDLIPPGSKAAAPKQQHQAEFRSPAGYFAEKQVGAVVSGGRSRLGAQAALLKKVEKATGVPGPVILAVWGRESGFGAAKIPHDAFRVLATKAFMASRKEMFRVELLAALEIVARGYAGSSQMKSSWAGALGQPQFMPSKYLAHAVDFDGDGHRDIWNSAPDTLASIGHYLKDFGWQAGRDWGFEVSVPDSVSCAEEGPDRGHKVADWAKRGIVRVSGKPFPDKELSRDGFLLMPAGRNGPAFIVTPNFYVLKEYNESDLYALFIGHAADRMGGTDRPFSVAFGKVDPMLRSDVAAMQRKLEKQGYDVGGADGLPGFKTRRSIGDWQAKHGMVPTCYPSAALAKALR
jgi:lytic murein transglycosylase